MKKSARTQRREALQQLEDEIKDVRKNLGDVNEKKYRLEMELNRVQGFLGGAQRRLEQNFGMTFEQALRTREFEDDAPNFTPRISGVIRLEKGDMNYAMSILKSADGDGSSCQRYTFAYSNPLAGKAKFIHTYKCSGDPLPSFEGEPKTVELPDTDIDTLTNIIWDNLNEDNKVSLFVRYIDLSDGTFDSRIINKNV